MYIDTDYGIAIDPVGQALARRAYGNAQMVDAVNIFGRRKSFHTHII